MADKKISALTAASTPLAGSEVLPIVQSGSTVKVSVSNLTAGRPVSASSLEAVGNGDLVTIKYASDGGSALLEWAKSDNTTLWTVGGGVVERQDELAFRRGSTNVFYLDNSNNVRVPTGNLVVGTAGKGIDFSANANAQGMTSELLDWYEEGTWVPVAEGSTSAGTCTYSFQQAHYVRTGGMVQFTCALGWSGHTGTGDLKITGLPFAVPGNQDSAPCGVWSWGLTFPGQLTAYTSGSAINLISIASGAGITAIAVDTDVASLQISGFYFVT